MTKIIAYKGFDLNLACRGHQFEIGKTYEVAGAVRACRNGFHACEYPLSVFDYYAPATSRFALVELEGATDAEGDKIAAQKMTVIRELTHFEMIDAAIKYTLARTTLEEGATASGDQGAATASGYQGAATASGTRGAATASGYAGRVSGAEGNALFVVERGEWDGKGYPILSVACGIVGKDGLKADVWYRAKGGKLVEVE